MNELAVVKYDLTDVAIEKMKADYMPLKIDGLQDKEGFDRVHEARMVVKTHRVAVQKREQEYKDQLNSKKKEVMDLAKDIYKRLEPIESHLEAEEGKVTAEKERIDKEKKQKELYRVTAIRAKIFAMQQIVSNLLGKTVPELQAISEKLFDTEITKEVYQEFTDEAERVKMECLDASLKAREVRIKWEAEEAVRKVEAERLEKQRKEQEAEAKRLADEKAKLEADKKADQARKDREEIEHQAKERAEKDAREKVEREAKEKKEKEEAEAKALELKKAQAPDKEKLLAFADDLSAVRIFDLNTEAANIILNDAMKALRGIVAMIRKEASAL